jgi:hypothetical protein
MHAPDLDSSIINDQECSKYLADKFFDWGNDEDIILQTEEKNHHRGGNEILEFEGRSEIYGE